MMYKCTKCGYIGKKLIFQFNSYGYCIASNEDNPDFISVSPQWAENNCFGDAKIGEPIGCPKCHAWGEHNFQKAS